MARAVGIDLGTTNSAIAVLEGGEPTIIPNAEGGRTTPSVVAFSKSGEVLVGEVAKRQAVTNVDRTISSVKRRMGTDWSVTIDGKKYTAQEISARILAKLKADAEAYLGEPVTNAVITVPAYFNDAERQATKEAGTIAGLTVDRIVNEPTAAALAYGLDKGKEDELILVFDLGGGTFDVSLLEVGKDDDGFSTIQVRATNGDNRLGGDDWDARIVDWLIKQVKSKNGVDLSKDKIAMQRLKDAAEQAKKELSSATSTNINLQYLSMSESGPVHLDEKLTRSHFEEMTADLRLLAQHDPKTAEQPIMIPSHIEDWDHPGPYSLITIGKRIQSLTGFPDIIRFLHYEGKLLLANPGSASPARPEQIPLPLLRAHVRLLRQTVRLHTVQRQLTWLVTCDGYLPLSLIERTACGPCADDTEIVGALHTVEALEDLIEARESSRPVAEGVFPSLRDAWEQAQELIRDGERRLSTAKMRGSSCAPVSTMSVSDGKVGTVYGSDARGVPLCLLMNRKQVRDSHR